MSDLRKSAIRNIVLKHLQGQHDQKRHGWRHSTVSGIKRTLRRESASGRIEYATAHRKRGMSEEDALYATISRVERRISKLPTEKFIVFSSDGKVLFEKGGDKSGVEFTDNELDKMKNYADNDDVIFTHNHPSSLSGKRGTQETIGRSFSKEDVIFAMAENFSQLRAVSADGSVYIMKRPKGGWPKIDIDIVDAVLYNVDRSVHALLSGRIQRGEMTVQEAKGRHGDYVIKEFLKAFEKDGYAVPYYSKEELPAAYQRR